MANSLYYTFSTISQTLAGAIGFLAAVVLYRVQSLETELLRHGEVVVAHWPRVSANDANKEAAAAHRTWLQRDFRGLVAVIDALPEGVIHQERRDDVTRFCALSQQRSNLLRIFYISLGLTATTIIASGFVLVQTPWLSSGSAPLILMAGFGALAVCIGSYIAVALRIFGGAGTQ